MKYNYTKLLLYISIGLLLAIILYPIILNIFIPNLQNQGTFGDSFGALNTFFSGLALCGIIVSIFMQRNEMSLQREEMELQREEMTSSRYEYTHNRITNLVYSQLLKFEKSIENLEIKKLANNPKGNNAIYYLSKNLNNVTNTKENKSEQLVEALANKKEILHNFFILTSVQEELTTFIISAHNCITTLQSILDNSSLNDKDTKELKELFVNNIGILFPGILENIENTVHFLGFFYKELKLNSNENIIAINNLRDIYFFIDDVKIFLDQ